MIRSSCQGTAVQLGGASEDCLEVRFVGIMVKGNYAWCFVIFVIFMGFGGAKVGNVLKPFRGWQCKPQEGSSILMEGGFSLYAILLCRTFVTGYCKRFYRLRPFPKLLLFHLFCIY